MTEFIIILSVLTALVFIGISIYKIAKISEDYIAYTKSEAKAKCTEEDYEFKVNFNK